MKPDDNPGNPPESNQDFPIIGIGASAGGLDAFKKLLKAIPIKSGMAYVLVQHLDPNHESLLPEILARITEVPVNEITNDIHLAPDHIYVIPENKILTSEDGVLKLAPRDKNKMNKAIDVFFTSLAEVHKELSVGVVLSGTGHDGSIGLKSIKLHGGTTFAQATNTAAYPDMPQNAINSNVVDFILPPEDIPLRLVELLNVESFDKNENAQPNEDLFFKKIIRLLSESNGVDFTFYKQTTIRRRIMRRFALSNKPTLNQYVTLLNSDKNELENLFRDVLIPVTSFFRDAKIFATIKEQILPSLILENSSSLPVRVWIAGCSTGEEAYSLAILIQDYLEKIGSKRTIQIFASDLSSNSIMHARSGSYPSALIKNISEDLLKKHFVKSGEQYQVKKHIRDICVFAVHNFLKDPPFAKMDLISCRNVLIYMDNFLQKKALSTFHYALNESGFLILGKSETTGTSSDLFQSVAKSDKIYSRKKVSSHYLYQAYKNGGLRSGDSEIKESNTQHNYIDFQKIAESILLKTYTPASVVINQQYDIVNINGDISPFLKHNQGKPSFNLLKMAREGLVFDLRNLLNKIGTSKETVSKKGIYIKNEEGHVKINIDIVPLPDTIEVYYLVLFKKENLVRKIKTQSLLEKQNVSEYLQRISQLENDIASSHVDVNLIAEQHEVANEELQSANEELLSGSEELQSLNEELETSKEELQSSNEELIIVNQELTDKQVEINNLRLYSEAIIATVKEPLVVMDKDLIIKSINKSFYDKFNINELESVGKYIYELQHDLFNTPELITLLEGVLGRRNEIKNYEMQIQIPKIGKCFILVNAQKINNIGNKEALILLSIEDYTERKLIEKEQQKLADDLLKVNTEMNVQQEKINFSKQYVEAIIGTVREPLVILDKDLRIKSINNSFIKVFNINELESSGQLFYEVKDNLFDNNKLRSLLEKILTKRTQINDHEITINQLGIGERSFLINARQIINEVKKEQQILLALEEYSDRKLLQTHNRLLFEELESKVKERTASLEQSNIQLEQFAHTASHEFQEPLRKIVTFSRILQTKSEENKKEEVKNYLEKIEKSSLRMSVLIQDMLNFSVVNNHTKLVERTDLNKILKNILFDFELNISEKNAIITSDILPEIDAIPFQMNQLLYDIISNALKFSIPGVPPVIRISSKKLTSDELKMYPHLNLNMNYYRITIKDNGIGFDQKYAGQIFTMFQRLDISGNYPGTGMGLAFCKKIVHNYHGEIYAQSKKNEGTSIHVILPGYASTEI